MTARRLSPDELAALERDVFEPVEHLIARAEQRAIAESRGPVTIDRAEALLDAIQALDARAAAIVLAALDDSTGHAHTTRH